MKCANCDQPIPEARQLALPGETWCHSCVLESGDVERIKGVMLWHHKTSPEFYMGPGTEKILAHQRRGPHAQMAFTSKENPFVLKSLESFNVSEGMNLRERPETEISLEPAQTLMARCHPDRPRVSPNGRCLECSVEWYKIRVGRK